ncbi:MAG: hypothetical protein ACR2IE_09235 [Candidatus Sumerlaeaceae bacterium]
MDLTIPILTGLAMMPSLISGPMTSSVGTSICAPSCAPLPCGYVVAKHSPVESLLPCGSGYGHSSAYNFGVYPVQGYLYASARSKHARLLEK